MSNENKNRRLQELGGSDFEIADGQPDIRGWDVKNEAGKKIGEVDELIFDVQSRKVRYIVLDLDDNDLNIDDGRDVLVPIGIAQLHDKDDNVILPQVTVQQLEALPEYEEGNINADVENKIRTVFAGASGAAFADAGIPGTETDSDDSSFYNHDHFNDNNLYGNRRSDKDVDTTIPVIKEELQVGKKEIEKGGIRLRTRVVENQVEENINLRKEKIHVERTPVDRPADVTDLKEEQLEFIERSEVPVVSKEARVIEEVSLNKDVTQKQESIKDTVKSTEIDIERTGKTDDTEREVNSI